MTLVAEFKGSDEFQKLSPSSVRAYTAYIKLIENKFGDLPLAALDGRRVRGEFKAWRDRFASTPRKADYAWTTLSRIFSFRKDRGLIGSNPREGGGRLYTADRTDKIWRDEDVAAFLESAAPELTLAMVSLSGQANGKATYSACLGRPMTANAFVCSSLKLIAGSWCQRVSP